MHTLVLLLFEYALELCLSGFCEPDLCFDLSEAFVASELRLESRWLWRATEDAELCLSPRSGLLFVLDVEVGCLEVCGSPPSDLTLTSRGSIKIDFLKLTS